MAEHEYVLAMHDYIPPEGSTCLSFRAGQVIHVLNRDPSGWWDGELEGKRGWFPSNFVHVDDEDEDFGPGDVEEEEGEEETFNARMPLVSRNLRSGSYTNLKDHPILPGHAEKNALTLLQPFQYICPYS